MKINEFLLLSIFLMLADLAVAQADTIYIYEEIIVYDTAYVYDTIVVEDKHITGVNFNDSNILQLDAISGKASLLIISSHETATIPINHIILTENVKNLDSMKKLSFLGLMALAFNSMVWAQTDYGISLQEGVWWANCNKPEVNNITVSEPKLSQIQGVNLYLRHQFKNGIFTEAKLKYSYLSPNESYRARYYTEDQWTGKADAWCNYMVWHTGIDLGMDRESFGASYEATEAANTAYHQIGLPISVGYTYHKFSPYIGAKYSMDIFSQARTEPSPSSEFPSYASYEVRNNVRCNFGLIAGIDYTITPRWRVGFTYYHGLSKDYSYLGDFNRQRTISTADGVSREFETLSSDTYNWKSRSLEFSVSYSLKGIGKKRSDD